MGRRLRCFRRTNMFRHLLHGGERGKIGNRADTSAVEAKPSAMNCAPPFGSLRFLQRMMFVVMVLLSLFVVACESGPSAPQGNGNGTTTTTGGPSFPSTALQLRAPSFGSGEQVAPTVKVLASADPTLIVQFPLVPSGIKALFPNASGLVTVLQNPNTNDFD